MRVVLFKDLLQIRDWDDNRNSARESKKEPPIKLRPGYEKKAGVNARISPQIPVVKTET